LSSSSFDLKVSQLFGSPTRGPSSFIIWLADIFVKCVH